MKLQYSIYGNCQADALASCLNRMSEFRDKYDYIPLKAVQHIKHSDVEVVKNIFSKIDLIIYQNISESYRIPELSTNRLLKLIPSHAVPISIPSLYFNGYFPHLDTLGGIKSVTNLVHDFNIIAGYLLDIPENRLYEIIGSKDFYEQEEAHSFLNQSILNLQQRELRNKVDIKVSQFISTSYRDVKVFNQFSHPTGFLFSFCVASILKKLMISFENSEIREIENHAPLEAIRYSIYPSTAYHLNLKFVNDFTNDKVLGVHGKNTLTRS